jgi:hypothetical protein
MEPKEKQKKTKPIMKNKMKENIETKIVKPLKKIEN